MDVWVGLVTSLAKRGVRQDVNWTDKFICSSTDFFINLLKNYLNCLVRFKFISYFREVFNYYEVTVLIVTGDEIADPRLRHLVAGPRSHQQWAGDHVELRTGVAGPLGAHWASNPGPPQARHQV